MVITFSCVAHCAGIWYDGYDYCFENLFNKNFFQPHLFYYETSGIIGIIFLYVLLFFQL